MTCRLAAKLAVVMALGGALGGCFYTQPTPQTTTPGSAFIGPDGGTVVSEDQQVTLVIPPGAVTTKQFISITPSGETPLPLGATPVSSAYNAGPFLLIVNLPMTLTMNFSPSEVPDGQTAQIYAAPIGDQGSSYVTTVSSNQASTEVPGLMVFQVGAAVPQVTTTVTGGTTGYTAAVSSATSNISTSGSSGGSPGSSGSSGSNGSSGSTDTVAASASSGSSGSSAVTATSGSSSSGASGSSGATAGSSASSGSSGTSGSSGGSTGSESSGSSGGSTGP